MDEDMPRSKTDLITLLSQQSLDPLSMAELKARIACLQSEISRTEKHIAMATHIHADAAALFRKNEG